MMESMEIDGKNVEGNDNDGTCNIENPMRRKTEFSLPNTLGKRYALDEANTQFPWYNIPGRVFVLLTHPSNELGHGDQRRRARLFSALTLSMIIATGVLCGAVFSDEMEAGVIQWTSLGVFLSVILSYFLSRTKNYMLGVHISIFAVWCLSFCTTVVSINQDKASHFVWSNFGSWVYTPVWMLILSLFGTMPECVIYITLDTTVLWLLPLITGHKFYYIHNLVLYRFVSLGTLCLACIIIRRDIRELEIIRKAIASGTTLVQSYSRTHNLRSSKLLSLDFLNTLLWMPHHTITLGSERRRARILSGTLIWSIFLVLAVLFTGEGDLDMILVSLSVLTLAYGLSRTTYTRVATDLSLFYVWVFPYLLRALKGPYYFESASLFNLLSSTCVALLGVAILHPPELLIYALGEIVLICYNPYFHPQFALAFLLPFVALVSFLDRRDLRSSSRLREESRDDDGRRLIKSFGGFDIGGKRARSHIVWTLLTFTFVLLLALVFVTYCSGSGDGRGFTGKVIVPRLAVVRRRYSPESSSNINGGCSAGVDHDIENDESIEVSDESLSDGSWCMNPGEKIYSTSFSVGKCSKEAGQRYYFTCSRGSFYGYIDQPLCDVSETMVLFCLPEDIGDNCRVDVELGTKNFVLWKPQTCQFGPNLRYREAELNLDNYDSSSPVLANQTSPGSIYISDSGISEISSSTSKYSIGAFSTSDFGWNTRVWHPDEDKRNLFFTFSPTFYLSPKITATTSKQFVVDSAIDTEKCEDEQEINFDYRKARRSLFNSKVSSNPSSAERRNLAGCNYNTNSGSKSKKKLARCYKSHVKSYCKGKCNKKCKKKLKCKC